MKGCFSVRLGWHLVRSLGMLACVVHITGAVFKEQGPGLYCINRLCIYW